MKSQMKRADKLGARYVAILGDDELARGAWTVRDMGGSSQESVPLAGLAGRLRERIPRG
jgi:histidyl-tRNA synthetase